ncbi:MAG: hypothetical protein M3R47_11870, partial [Chloroflexota bacterium]|nr:hypothetical protein [Chloroflexota bacterium]
MKISKGQLRASLTILLIVLFIGQSCGAIAPTATFSATNSLKPTVTLPHPKTPIPPSQAPTRTMPVVPTATTPPDLIANLQTVVTAIETNQPEMLRSLISEQGVAAGGFAQDAQLKGYNNSDEIVAAFTEALDQSTPVCEG